MSTPTAPAVRKGPNWIVTSVGALIVLGGHGSTAFGAFTIGLPVRGG